MSSTRVNSLRPFLAIAGIALVGIGILLVVRNRSNMEDSAPKVAGQASGATECIQIGKNHWRISKAAKARYVALPSRINEDVQLSPTMGAEPDAITELHIAKLSSAGPLSAAGFKVGDKILKVNRKPVNTLTRALHLSQEVESAAHVTVQIQRAAEILEFRFDFE